MPTYRGRSYSLIGSPEQWLADDDYSLAPPEAVTALNKRALRKLKQRLGHKPSGALRKAQTVGEHRRAMLKQGFSIEQIAESEGLDYETIERSLRRDAQRRCGQ
jgi:hypothetical protein